jgi:sugar phosphate isomerase/epimerase
VKNRIGCNTIDPLLQVRDGKDYTMDVTRRTLEFLAEMGFEDVEYSHCMHWTDRELDLVREMARQCGLGPWSLHAWAGGDVLEPAGARETAKILARAADVALGLGVRRVVHHTSGRARARDGGESLSREADIIRAAWKPGFVFGLETETTGAHFEYLLALVDELGPEIAGVNVDTGHPHLGTEVGAAEAIRRAGPRLVTTHLHDNHGVDDEHMPPGDGTIDWEDVAAALREVGYRGCVMLELTDQPSPERRAKGARADLERGARMARWIADKLKEAAPGL